MATTTTNYNLTKPARGDTSWDGAVNGNFDLIDAKLKSLETGLANAGTGNGSAVYTQTVTFTGAQSYVVTHNLNTLVPVIQVQGISGARKIAVTIVDANSIKLTSVGVMSVNVVISGGTATTGTQSNTSPTVTTSPANQSAITGATVTYTAAATGNPTPTVQWQVSTDVGTTWTNISGATSPTYSFELLNPAMYRAVFTNAAGSVDSTSASATVTGLVAAWPMHEGSGSTFNDLVAGLNLTAANGSGTWGSGKYTFNGTGGAVAASTTGTAFDGTTPFSVSVWFNSLGSGAGALLSTLQSSGTINGWDINYNILGADKVEFRIINNYPSNMLSAGTNAPFTSGLHNLIVIYDGSRSFAGISMYLDGVQQGLSSLSDALTGSAVSTVPVHIGTDMFSENFNGPISNVRIFNRVLTSGEISALVAQGA